MSPTSYWFRVLLFCLFLQRKKHAAPCFHLGCDEAFLITKYDGHIQGDDDDDDESGVCGPEWKWPAVMVRHATTTKTTMQHMDGCG